MGIGDPSDTAGLRPSAQGPRKGKIGSASSAVPTRWSSGSILPEIARAWPHAGTFRQPVWPQVHGHGGVSGAEGEVPERNPGLHRLMHREDGRSAASPACSAPRSARPTASPSSPRRPATRTRSAPRSSRSTSCAASSAVCASKPAPRRHPHGHRGARVWRWISAATRSWQDRSAQARHAVQGGPGRHRRGLAHPPADGQAVRSAEVARRKGITRRRPPDLGRRQRPGAADAAKRGSRAWL